MIKRDANLFTVNTKNNTRLMVSIMLVVFLIVIIVSKIENSIYTYSLLYLCVSLGMLLLFIRIDRRQVAYYWIKKNKFSKYMFLDIEGSFIPLRFFISSMYFYVQLIICISLYIFIILNPFELEIDIQVFTFWIIGIFNVVPIFTFAVFEAIENKKCNNVKLY